MKNLNNKNFQKIYKANLVVFCVICLLLIFWLVLSLFSIVQIESHYVFILTIVFAAFFYFCNYMWKKQNKFLKPVFPKNFPRKFFQFLPVIGWLLFIILMIYGLLLYPYAPLKSLNGNFLDKAGNKHSLAEYQRVQNWESALMISFTICALPSILLSPFYDKKSGTWKY